MQNIGFMDDRPMSLTAQSRPLAQSSHAAIAARLPAVRCVCENAVIHLKQSESMVPFDFPTSGTALIRSLKVAIGTTGGLLTFGAGQLRQH